MTNKLKILVISALYSASFLALPQSVLAYSPYLSAQYQNNGYNNYNNNVQITISNGMPFASVSLYYRQSSSLWTNINNLGQTDSGGYFTQVISMPSDNSSSQIQMYAVVGSDQTSTISVYPGYNGGCTYNCGSPYNLSLSQTSLNLNTGQSATVNILAYSNNYYQNNYYISSNSNSNVASASISGSSIYVYANNSGSTTISVCGYSSNCASLYVTVSGYYGGSNITFSPSNPVLNVGQSLNVYMSSNNYGSNYYISSNSNSNSVSANINGSVLNLYGNQYGSSSITVCQNSNSNCGTVYAQVNNNNNTNILSLSQTSLSLNTGQSSTVYIYNYSGSVYISTNTNSNVASASISGSSMYVYANNNGSTTITVCGYSNSCANLYVNVSGYNGGCTYNCGGSNISLSQTNLNLNSGQSSTVTIYGNGSYYISSNSNSNVASASVNGSSVYIYANNSGSTTISVCQSYSGGCASVYVNVNSSSYYGGTLYLNTNTLPQIIVGQYYNYQLQASGGSYPYTYTLMSGSLPNGLYLTSSGLIYGTPNVFNSNSFVVRVSDAYGRTGQATFNLNGSNVSGGGSVLGLSAYPSGALIKENGTIYIVYKNTKTGFATAAAFTGLGFNFNNVTNSGNSGLGDSGFIVKTANAQHPWGSWIKNGQTVYFVHELGLIPVPDWNTFINNGGQSSMVVPANSYDFRLSILSAMVPSDARVR